METKTKELYETPAATSVEVKQEGVICSSPGPAGVQDYVWITVTEE